MALMDDILSEILGMDNEERKNLLVYLQSGKYSTPVVYKTEVDMDSMAYLKGLSNSSLDFIKLVLENYDLNLYHSAAAIIQGNHGGSLQGKIDYYIKKYQVKRPWLLGHEKEIAEIFNHVSEKLGRKDLRLRNTFGLIGGIRKIKY